MSEFDMMDVTKNTIIDKLEHLPPESLSELQAFIEFLHFKSGKQASKMAASRQTMWQSALQATFGLWADREEVASGGVVYVQRIRRGHRLNDLLGPIDESD